MKMFCERGESEKSDKRKKELQKISPREREGERESEMKGKKEKMKSQ